VLRGVSKIVSTIALLAMVVAGISAVWYVFSGNLSAYSSAALVANVKGSFDGTKTTLEIVIRNTGGSSANITKVEVDDVDITNDLFSPDGYYIVLPGSSIQKVIIEPKDKGIGPGSHILKITYKEHGIEKETYVEFVI